jgi:CRISPR-associated protein Cmr4
MILTRPYLLQALSPLHAGTGQSVAAIDLPIARMRATGMPFVPGSSIKGVLRQARRPAGHAEDGRSLAVFGPSRPESGPAGDDGRIEHAGALVVGDARLLALPVRSFRGTFALVTSPLLLRLALRDLDPGHASPRVPALPRAQRAARVGTQPINLHGKHVYLEELDLPAEKDPAVDAWAGAIARALPEDGPSVAERLCVVDDDTMTFFWETATQVDTRVAIDGARGVVSEGALWTEESLSPETLLIGLLAAHGSLRNQEPMTPEDVLAHAVRSQGELLQFGGKATVGRGRCLLRPWPAGERGRQGGAS